jgi:amino acid transporter
LQAAIAALLVLLVGTETGRSSFDAALGVVGVNGMPWEEYFGGFETLVAGSSPVYWGLCLATGLAVFVLRATDRATPRPFSMPLYPLPAIAFCATCVYMLWNSMVYARWLAMLGLVPLALGGVVWFTMWKHGTPVPQRTPE